MLNTFNLHDLAIILNTTRDKVHNWVAGSTSISSHYYVYRPTSKIYTGYSGTIPTTPNSNYTQVVINIPNLFSIVKKQAAEAGYNLVRGSFEEGGTLASSTDVLWYQAGGKYYQWYLDEAKTVSAGSTPTNVGVDWIDKTDLSLRQDLLLDSGTSHIYHRNSTLKARLDRTVDITDYITDLSGICDSEIQAALDTVDAKCFYFPPQKNPVLLDSDIIIPAGVTFYCTSNTVELKMVGRDTHSRNCALFTKYTSQSILQSPSMVVLEGSNSLCAGFVLNGNGQNNFVEGATGRGAYLVEGSNIGYNCGRIGRYKRRANGESQSFIEHSHFYKCTFKLSAWGTASINGIGYRQAYDDSVTDDESLIGARYCSIMECTGINTFGNGFATFGVKDSKINSNTQINNVHKGYAAYVRTIDTEFCDNIYVYDETTDVSWRKGYTVAYNREAEFGTRSDAIAIGHSDYNTLIRNIKVSGNKLRGNGLIQQGIEVFSNTVDISITDNDVTGFVSPLAVAASHNLHVSANRTKANNLQHTDASTNYYYGSDVQYTSKSSEYTKTAPSFMCSQHFVGNTFSSVGCNHVRGNQFEVFDTLGCGLSVSFSSNRFNSMGLTSINSKLAIPIQINDSIAATGSTILFDENNTFTSLSSGLLQDGSSIIDTTQLYKLVHLLGKHFSWTPTPIGSTTAGVASGVTVRAGIITEYAGNFVEIALEVNWTGHTGAGNLRIAGLPVAAKSTANGNITASLFGHFSGLTFTGYVVPVVTNSATTIDLYQMVSGSGVSNVAMDTAVYVLRVSGRYSI